VLFITSLYDGGGEQLLQVHVVYVRCVSSQLYALFKFPPYRCVAGRRKQNFKFLIYSLDEYALKQIMW